MRRLSVRSSLSTQVHCSLAYFAFSVMLAVLCVRPKPWILSSSSVHGLQAHHHYQYSSRIGRSPIHFVGFRGDRQPRLHHSNTCRLGGSFGGRAASIWHAIMPYGTTGIPSDLLLRRKAMLRRERTGEGSWNAAWDARPARWLHLPDSAWLLFGVCACLAPLDLASDGNPEAVVLEEKVEACDSIDLNACKNNEVVGCDVIDSNATKNNDGSADYRVTGHLHSIIHLYICLKAISLLVFCLTKKRKA